MKHALDWLLPFVLTPLIICTVILFVGPLVLTVMMSFDSRSFLGTMPPPEFSMQWYRAFFSSNYFLTALQTSLLVAFVSSILATIIGTVAALGISSLDNAFTRAAAGLFLSPLIVPHVVLGFSLLLFFSLIGVQWSLLKIILGHIIVITPFTIRTALASTVGMSPSLREAALSLGATEWQVIWEITIPGMRTGIVAGFIIAFAVSMDDVSMTIFLTDPTAYTLPVALLSAMTTDFSLTIAAATVMLMLLALAIILILDRVLGIDRVLGRGLHGAA